MDDLPNLLQRDYGLKPQGKSAPMAGASAGASHHQKRIGNDPTGQALSSYGGAGGHMNVYDDVFGGPPKFAAGSYQQDGGYDDIFRTFSAPIKNSALPVFDTPVYDDEDIFGGVKGVRSGGVRYDDVFSGGSGAGVGVPATASQIEDLLGEGRVSSPREQGNLNLRRGGGGGEQGNNRISRYAGETRLRHWEGTASPRKHKGNSSFHDPLQQLNMSSQPTSNKETKVSSNGMKGIDGMNAFDGLPLTGRATTSPINKARVAKSPSKTNYISPTHTRGQTELAEGKSVKKSSGLNNFVRDRMKSHTSSKISSPRRHRQPLHENSTFVTDLSSRGLSPLKKSEKGTDVRDRLVSVDEIKLLTKPTTFPPPSRPPPPLVLKQGPSSKETLEASTEHYSHSTIHPNTFTVHQLQSGKASRYSSNQEHETFASGGSREKLSPLIDGMLEGSSAAAASTVAMKEAMERAETRLKLAKEAREKKREDWEREAKMAKSQEKERQNRRDERKPQEDWEREEKERLMKAAQEDHELEEKEKVARAAREAHEREEKEKATKAAQEAREREEKEAAAKAAREARAAREAYEREEKEKAAKAAQEAREREEKEATAKAAREARERAQREREQQEKERRQREREREIEREKEREREREREKDRIAVERATKEARERAEKYAVERASTEARERAERAAFERVSGEARERAAAEVKERAAAERAAVERAATTVRERPAAERAVTERTATTVRERPAAERAVTERAEARIRVERAASERAMAEARERAAERAAVERVAAEARERAERAVAERAAVAAAARERQRRNENDLESFFGMSSRPDSAAKQRPATSNVSGEVFQKATAGTPQSYKRSNTNTTDDWTSLFTASSSDEFQEIPGETAERRRARWERHQRTVERAAKALAEKNDRDLQAQREQAERHRMAETLDADVKRWATGKEGNLRALLSTLQYILWPECGWQPVSLTDIIAAASVKKVYRKATLCVHPDKVQQKGATIQQKYIAEKVFDLLKEAWNKFNSEELF